MFPAESLMGELVGVPWVSCSALHSFSITLDWGGGEPFLLGIFLME